MASLASYQLINKILQDKDYGIIRRNSLDENYFAGYTDEFNFIVEHYKKFGNIPDTLTFLGNFQNFDLAEVYETEDYLIDKLHEEYGFQKFNQILPEVSKRLQGDSRDAYNFLIDNLTVLKPHTVCKGIDIIEDAHDRYDAYINRSTATTPPTISTGFTELDEIFGGWEYGEELVTLVARTNQGKSWLLLKFLSEAWQQGKRVGLYSGEMSENKIGYRFDSLYKHFSNRALVRGNKTEEDYEEYINTLSKDKRGRLIVVTKKTFGGAPTVPQIRSFIEENNIEIMGIDQLSLMSDHRANRNDPPRMRLSHISEDLFLLSADYKIPILALAQSNRKSVEKDDAMAAPGLENIKESDDIAHNSSKCIGMKQYNEGMILDIIKNREGRVGDKLFYAWQIDTGTFSYVPINGDAAKPETREHVTKQSVKKFEVNTENSPF